MYQEGGGTWVQWVQVVGREDYVVEERAATVRLSPEQRNLPL